MNRIITAILALALLVPCRASAQQLDSTRLAPLDSLLGEYYEAMIYEALPTKYQECDFLIESCKDSLVRQWVTSRILLHYTQDPPLMGEEAVAVYVYDKWVASGAVTLADDYEAFAIKLFVDFNRSSLLGMKAPVLELLPPVGPDKVRIPQKGTVSVLYFYDTSCSKCKATSVMLPRVLEGYGFPINLYAIYTGQDGDEWAEFRAGFTCENPNVSISHLWDPEIDSDYQKQYGVLTTPKMFLVDTEGIIQGRRLQIESFPEILPIFEAKANNK